MTIELMSELMQDRTVGLSFMAYGLYHYFGGNVQHYVNNFVSSFT